MSVKRILTMVQFKFFVGIDVSKESLDFSVVSDGKELTVFKIGNCLKAIKAAILDLKKIKGYQFSQTLFCLEYTGLYNNYITSSLHSLGANIWVEKAIEIKRSSGLQRGKSDKVDAQRIAFFAFRNQDKVRLWSPPRTVIQQLKRLTAVRERLLTIVGQINTPLQESKKFDSKEVFEVVKNSCQSSLKAVKLDLKKVEKKIREVIKSDASLNHLFNLVTSVNGIGKVIACEMLITTNEFKSIDDPKKYACYAGVAPFEHTSGSSVRGKARVSHFANKNTKRLLHMGTISVLRYHNELKTYWLRRVQEGKNEMIVLNAIRNKLIHRVFAVVKRGTKYEKIYTNALA